MHLEVGAVVGIKDNVLNKLGNSQGFPCDKRIATWTHGYEIGLSEPCPLYIHKRWEDPILEQTDRVKEIQRWLTNADLLRALGTFDILVQ